MLMNAWLTMVMASYQLWIRPQSERWNQSFWDDLHNVESETQERKAPLGPFDSWLLHTYEQHRVRFWAMVMGAGALVAVPLCALSNWLSRW